MLNEYGLKGPQVEPEAGYWGFCPAPCMVSLDDLLKKTDTEGDPDYFPAWPDAHAAGCNGDIKGDIAELKRLAGLRDDPNAIKSSAPCRLRLPLSLFLQLRPVPLGAVVRPGRQQDPVIQTGRELSRYFESETPGLAHRQALNFLMGRTNWSPPRQALVWAALDVAIASALQAAWYYKWLSQRPQTSRRPRPIEVDDSLDVLYDRIVAFGGDGEMLDDTRRKPADLNLDCLLRPCPQPSPGTPRHPSYPSGHSTYGGAASELLSYFFPEFTDEFDKLADNAGMARLWAGIHYRTDHFAGMKLGRTVARLVIAQIVATGIVRCPDRSPCKDNMDKMPPTPKELEDAAAKFKDNCGKSQPQEPCDGTLNDNDREGFDRAQSPQQGAA